MKLVQVSIQKNGVYFMYQLPVTRGIRGKSKGKVNEVIVVGVPTNKVEDYVVRENLIITDRAVYANNDIDQPILFRDGDTLVYKEK